MLTCASLFSGFYSIIASINGNFFAASIGILVAAVFDGLDGRVARMTGSTSTFGMELDSLCDLISFGMAPALLAYFWALMPWGRYGWLAAFLYVATTALRLARFNAQALSNKKQNYNFVGLPCPAAAVMIVTSVLFSRFLGATDTVKHISILFLVYVLSYLMVSTHEYLSFKHSEIWKGKTFQMMVVMILLLILLATEPPVTLFAVSLLYVLSGPLIAVYRLVTRSKKKTSPNKSLS